MLEISSKDIVRLLGWRALTDALQDMFASGNFEAPARHHHSIPVPGQPDATLLLMPAWQVGTYVGVKMVTVFPGNASVGKPAISGSYVLMDGRNGEIAAMLDGGELTARRTAAVSALAARYLARKNARTMLMIGTGRLSLNLIEAHCVTRAIETVYVYGRSHEKAEHVAAAAQEKSIDAKAVTGLTEAAGNADVISCATLSTKAILKGAWLRPGTHVDLVGAFKPTMREADDAVMTRAAGIFVDTREGAFGEAGDILQAIASGALSKDLITADLFDLTGGKNPGRRNEDDITVFKSVGSSLSDLAAAVMALESFGRERTGT